MKILMVSQHYWPESFINTEICETLVERGHAVTVLTGLPNYPDGVIPEEYRLGRNRRQTRAGVEIIRVPLVARGLDLHGLGKVRRAANYGSFLVSGWLRVRRMSPDFDVVLALQTSPVTMAAPAIAYGKRFGARVLIRCCDLSPADLLVVGIGEDSPVYKLYRRIARRIYQAADVIAVTSASFSDYLREVVGIGPDRITLLPEFAEDIFSSADDACPIDHEFRAAFAPGEVHFVFAGNVGSFQAAETIIRAAAELRHEKLLRFHIVGSGSRLESCKRIAESNRLDNVVFHGRKPLELMPAYYAQADAMLMTLCDNPTDPVVSYTLPRRTQTILAAGKPIIAAAGGEVAHVIGDAECGYCCRAERHDELAELCLRFASTSSDERSTMRMNARRYYDEHYTKDRFFEQLELLLETLSAQHR